MNVYSNEQADLNYTDRPPVLLAASGGAAMRRAERTISANGLRVGAKLPIEDALARIEVQAAATAVWLEIDSDCGERLDELLTHLSHDVSRGFYRAVVSTTPALLDVVMARVSDVEVEIIVDANEAERSAALAIAVASDDFAERFSDIGSDQNAERLRQLSEEVSRIASTLARLSTGPSILRRSPESAPTAELPPLSADTILKVIRGRRLRGKYFDETLFADPAWDMMLDLLQSEIAQHRVPVSNLCIAAAVPATTALRWLKMLVGQGLFVRRADPHDGRRVFVELAPDTSHALRRYFAEVEQLATI
jgi:predicted transcriptional regulator